MSKNSKGNAAGWIVNILLSLLVLLGFVCFFAVIWYINTYGDMGFDSIMFTLLSGLGGVQDGLVSDYILEGLIPAVICTLISCFIIFFRANKKITVTLFHKLKIRLYPFSKIFSRILATALALVLIIIAAVDVRLVDYIEAASKQSVIYQEKYVDPLSVEITFPESKQNLIYIYLESMETTFLSEEQGGGVSENLIPELYSLAEDNVNFSNNSDVGGFVSAHGTNWTAAAMVASTAGIPLKPPSYMSSNTYGSDSFLPGANTMTNVLKNNGYFQALMVGSDASFGNRDRYYEQHGVDAIYDLFTAYEEGIVPKGYNTWWGMEDRHLYTYAMRKLPELAAMEQPFAFTMLTVDTHHIGGYICDKCKRKHTEQYEDVINCASRQLNEFIDWIKQQDFFENTTIVISGDHITMDSGYITRNTKQGYTRHVYNCFINAMSTPHNSKNRTFTAMDMFPTTLAAMGCSIKGERLGLGTNLFSNEKTLAEQMGIGELNAELSLASKYYIENFML